MKYTLEESSLFFTKQEKKIIDILNRSMTALRDCDDDRMKEIGFDMGIQLMHDLGITKDQAVYYAATEVAIEKAFKRGWNVVWP